MNRTIDRLTFVLSYHLGILSLFLQFLTAGEIDSVLIIHSFDVEVTEDNGYERTVLVKPTGWNEDESITLKMLGYDISRVWVTSPKLIPPTGRASIGFKTHPNPYGLELRTSETGNALNKLQAAAERVAHVVKISCEAF